MATTADAEPELVWDIHYEGEVAEYAGGSPGGLAALEDGVVASQNGFIAELIDSRVALRRFDAGGALVGKTTYGGEGEGDGGLADLVSVPGLGLLYLAGYTTYDAGLTTPGAHQSFRECFGDGAWCAEEGFIAQFDASGELKWGTYFGGPFEERIVGASADASGALYVCGTTNSSTGMATATAEQAILPGDDAGFVAKFDVDGTLQWSTYDDRPCMAAAADPGGGLVVAGIDEPFTEPPGGDDVWVARFGSAGRKEWNVGFGGSEFESADAIAVAATGAVYLAGLTYSQQGIATPGAHQEMPGGGDEADIYIVKFAPNGEKEWATYFGGEAAEDHPRAAIDDEGDLYVAAVTDSVDLATASGSSSPSTEQADVVLARFDEGGALVWSLYYGNDEDETVIGVAVDPSGRVYLNGQAPSPADTPDEPPGMYLAMFREKA